MDRISGKYPRKLEDAVARRRKLTTWVKNSIISDQHFSAQDIQSLRVRLLAEAEASQTSVEIIVTGIISSWDGGTEYLISQLAKAISDYPEDFTKAIYQSTEGRERQSAMLSLEKALLNNGDGDGLEKAYATMSSGPEKQSMGSAILKNELKNASFEGGLDALERLESREDRQAGLWFLIGRMERIGLEKFDSRTLDRLKEKAVSEGMKSLWDATIKRNTAAKSSEAPDED